MFILGHLTGDCRMSVSGVSRSWRLYSQHAGFRIALHITCRRFDSESRMKISVDDWLYLSGVRRVCSGTSLAGKLGALEVRMLDVPILGVRV